MLVLVATLTRGFRARAVVLGPHIVNHRAPAPSLAAAAHLSTKAGACEISPASHGTEPLDNFEDIGGLDARLVRALRDANYRTPTTIQAHAMPLLVRGDDVMASAQTGSGKTLMFLLPLIQRLLSDSARARSSSAIAPCALVLSPTRELAAQIADVASQLATPAGLRVVLATGGADMRAQRRELAQGCDLLVGTPGRVLQWADERVISLRSCAEVVVDEADRMLDLGFEPQLRRMARLLGSQPSTGSGSDRHTILCSATFPSEVQRLASDFLRPDYYFIAAGRVGATHSRIEQRLIWEDGGEAKRRSAALKEVKAFLSSSRASTKEDGQSLRPSGPPRALVFVNTKEAADRMGEALQGVTGGVRVVHGDKEQSARNRALADFRDGRCSTLVATDVAARGLDVPGVGLVVQCDMPRDADTFVHRIGRTGRAGASGRAVAVVDARALGLSSRLVEILGEAAQPVPAWLAGMSHIATARKLDEEGAIAAGGGGSGFASVVANDVAEQADGDSAEGSSEFSAQDFRSRAADGSWGSARDTSFRSFDEEAYGGTTGEVITEALPLPAADSMDAIADSTTSPASDSDSGEPSQAAQPTMDLRYELTRAPLSGELRKVLREVAGSDKMPTTSIPDKRVLAALSRRQRHMPQARFEYLGLFPFSAVAESLSSSSRDGGGSPTSDADGGTTLPRLLMVAEKPSIAKAVAEALSGKRGPRQRRGISRALPVYEFTTDGFAPEHGQRCVATVTSVVGHVFSLAFAEEGVRRDDPSSYFTADVTKKEEGTTAKLRVVDHLRALAADADHLVLWLDCDAEGENIAHEVIGVTRRAMELAAARRAVESGAVPQPAAQSAVDIGMEADLNLGADSERDPEANVAMRRVHRAIFSAITPDALSAAFRALGRPEAVPDPLLSRSVDARQELDLRVGVAMTRLLTWRCVGAARRHFAPATKLVSYGPCQTPTLHFCVERAKEIERFEPKPFWSVAVEVAVERSKLQLCWLPDGGEINGDEGKDECRGLGEEGSGAEEDFYMSPAPASTFSEIAARRAVERVNATGLLRVASVSEAHESRRPPEGLNTVRLLVAGSKAMGMSPKQVMKTAEALYSQGLISYPRTETTKYDPTGFDARRLLSEHASHPEWGKTAAHLLRTKYKSSGRPPTTGRDAGDHPPITPTGRAATREQVGGGAAWRVYEFVARTFIGSLADELTFTRRKVLFELDDGRMGGGGGGSGRGGGSRGGEPAELFVHEDTQVDSLGFGGACHWVLRDINAVGKDDALPRFRPGDTARVAHASMRRQQTQPPRFLQEHELIERMDAHRIGTDASMAVHVSNIVDRSFVVVCDETGVPLRPPRPPRPGSKPLPRQVGRYMVPTPLGIQLIALFGDGRDLATARTDGGVGGGDNDVDNEPDDAPSPALLSLPAIRARMEAEVKQIARGELSKEEALEANLAWFQARYHELEASLSRHRVEHFGRGLEPIGPALKRWRRTGVFKDAQEQPKARSAGSGGSKRSPRSGRPGSTARAPGQRRNFHSGKAPAGRGRGRGRGRGPSGGGMKP